MKIKKFNNFSLIKESFSQSKEYVDFVKSIAKKRTFFTDNLLEVYDLGNKVNVSYYSYIVDSAGHLINVDIDKDDEYKMRYIISIDYLTKEEYNNSNDFFKIINDLNIIKVSIEELIDRCGEYLHLSLNRVLNEKNKISFIIHFEEDIKNEDLINAYNNWLKFEDEEYREGMRKLDEIYYGESIALSKFLDTNHTPETIDIGFMGDDEIYVIARYHRKSKQFIIDRSEIAASIEWFEENE